MKKWINQRLRTGLAIMFRYLFTELLQTKHFFEFYYILAIEEIDKINVERKVLKGGKGSKYIYFPICSSLICLLSLDTFPPFIPLFKPLFYLFPPLQNVEKLKKMLSLKKFYE